MELARIQLEEVIFRLEQGNLNRRKQQLAQALENWES
jgi:hypothetical protein